MISLNFLLNMESLVRNLPEIVSYNTAATAALIGQCGPWQWIRSDLIALISQRNTAGRSCVGLKQGIQAVLIRQTSGQMNALRPDPE